MSEIVTQAELIRRVTQEIVTRIEGGAVPAPGKSGSPSKDSCSCGCKKGTYSEVALRDGHCEIYTAPDSQRNVARGFVPLGISARHLHLSPAHLEVLFGKGAQLTPLKDLRQPGQFAAKETVSIIGRRGRAIENVRILGPCRGDTQVEVSLTDCIQLGLNPPVRPSGDHRDTPGILIVGPRGHLAIDRGVIRANRHIHLHTSEAAALRLANQDRVMVKIDGDKPVIYYDVQIRVNDQFISEMHLDTDDANAVGLGEGAMAQIIRSAQDIIVCGKLPG